MTNVSGTEEKRATRRSLFAFAVETLEREGYKVSRVPRGGKASLRQITKGSDSYKVSIRTSQDTWIAFPRNEKGWVTLNDVDFVVAVSVDDRHDPTEARVHMVPGDDARARFERAYQARTKAGHSLPVGRGIWVSLYEKESSDPISHVGAGMGLAHKAIAVRDLTIAKTSTNETVEVGDEETEYAKGGMDESLSVADAKRRLALTFGVPEASIKITIEH